MLRVGTVEHDDAVDAAETEHEDEVDGGGDEGLQDRRLRRTWGICTRRAGKVYKARYQLYRSQILQVNSKLVTRCYAKQYEIVLRCMSPCSVCTADFFQLKM